MSTNQRPYYSPCSTGSTGAPVPPSVHSAPPPACLVNENTGDVYCPRCRMWVSPVEITAFAKQPGFEDQLHQVYQHKDRDGICRYIFAPVTRLSGIPCPKVIAAPVGLNA